MLIVPHLSNIFRDKKNYSLVVTKLAPEKGFSTGTESASPKRQEPILREAGVPVELGSGKKQSYSIPPPEGSSGKSLGILYLACTSIWLHSLLK